MKFYVLLTIIYIACKYIQNLKKSRTALESHTSKKLIRWQILLTKALIIRTSFVIVDVNECESGTADCEHICINTIGGYNCDCEFGFALHDKDRRTCQKGIFQNIS